MPAGAQDAALKWPEIKIPKPRRENLLPQDVQQIKTRLEAIARAIRSAKSGDRDAVVAVHKALDETFKQHHEDMYRFEVARQAAAIITPTLDVGDPLMQVNVAMALSQMPYATIQPALVKMVAHPKNAGVRYLGWQGYQAARDLIQRKGKTDIDTMFKSLKARAGKETSPRVLGAMWDMMAMQGSGPGAATEKMRIRALGIMAASWRGPCEKVFAGDVEMAEAVRHGVVAAVEHISATKDKDARRDAVQMIVDVTYCAAKAFGKAFSDGELTGPSGRAAKTLLWECEKALNNVLGLRNLSGKRFIREVLTNPSLQNQLNTAIIRWVHPRTKRVYGVLAWVDFLKTKGYAIKTPTEAMFKPASPPTAKGSPTTKPAKGSSKTKPAKGSPKTKPVPPVRAKPAL